MKLFATLSITILSKLGNDLKYFKNGHPIELFISEQ